jgi:gamma-glutamyltranspeptidase/glutathione hydrolase
LLGDPNAAAIFGPGGAVLPAGANLVQPDLTSTLEVLRTQGVQGFYQGGFAGQFATAADQAGGGLTVADMNAALPQYLAPDIAQVKGAEIASIPTAPASASALPASAGFAALDKNGGVVACAVTMNNLFGTGRIAAGTGILLAASPRTGPVPLLAAAIAYKPGGGFLAAASGTGQQGAAQAAAQGIAIALSKQPAAPVAEPGRANIISCPGGVPGGEVPGDGCHHRRQ